MGKDGCGWVDYIIASDDPHDRALLDEFRNQAWEYGVLMRFIIAEPANINADSWAQMEQIQERDNDLQSRICERGKALRDAGQQPADEAAVKSWRASWVSLASYVQEGDSPAV